MFLGISLVALAIISVALESEAAAIGLGSLAMAALYYAGP